MNKVNRFNLIGIIIIAVLFIAWVAWIFTVSILGGSLFIFTFTLSFCLAYFNKIKDKTGTIEKK